jgi:hypothetical protein
MSTLRMACRLVTVLAVFATTWACGGETKDTDTEFTDASLMEVKITGDGESEEYDLNGDGKADMTSIFTRIGDPALPREERARLLARKEIDVNFDSKTDVKQFYGEDGELVREEMDLDFDSKIDAVDYYVDGARVRRELFLNFIEKPSMWKYYEEGKLVRKSRDTTGDGKADTFEFYDPEGNILRVGYDTKGDGKPDYYEEGGAK